MAEASTSLMPQPSVAEFRLKTERSEFHWKIANFLETINYYEAKWNPEDRDGPFVQSPYFANVHSDAYFYALLFPAGCKQYSRAKVGIFLQSLKGGVMASFRISVLDRKKRIVHSRGSETPKLFDGKNYGVLSKKTKWFDSEAFGWGFDDFLDRKNIPTDWLTEDGSLVFKIEVKAYQEPKMR